MDDFLAGLRHRELVRGGGKEAPCSFEIDDIEQKQTGRGPRKLGVGLLTSVDFSSRLVPDGLHLVA